MSKIKKKQLKIEGLSIFIRNKYIIRKMKELEIERIIVKFLNREANIQELNILDAYLRKEENIDTFNLFVKTEFISTSSMAEYDVDKAKETIRLKLKNKEQKRKFTVVYRYIAIAASIALIFGVTFFMMRDAKSELEITNEASIEIKAGSDKAILTLDNGNEVVLEKGKEYQEGKVMSDGKELIYVPGKNKGNSEQGLKYNYLTIPKGGQFFVQLSDSTKVWLNSESKLKYPVRFQKGKTRQVELVYGEAFFEVSPSIKNYGTKFSVLSKSQEISVLGTQFNLRTYKEDTEMATTLVEGKVRVQKGGNSKVLKPNQQSKTSSDTDKIDIEEVDASVEIAWVHGLFSFNEESLGEIMTVLSRWYDVSVFFKSEEKKKFLFSGKVERTKSIDNILKLIEETSTGQIEFEINDKIIIVK